MGNVARLAARLRYQLIHTLDPQRGMHDEDVRIACQQRAWRKLLREVKSRIRSSSVTFTAVAADPNSNV